MITQISTVSIYVEDQQDSLKFWTDKIGFKVKANHPMDPNANWIELGPPHSLQAKEMQPCCSIVIYPKSMMPNWKELKPSIVFLCDDVEKTYTELKSKGVKFIEEPKKMAWGTYAKFVDIDGMNFS
ncbi:MAG TPA: VOC family protein [Nitrososphaeraceae archaeon]|nr:VOC family protein [Nitrososphaeraceae archaeon]